MDRKLRDENTDMLMKAVMSAESIEECYDFFADLCSEGEIKTMSQRLQVARMLKENNVYSDIVRETKAGTKTICNVSKSMTDGRGGLKKAIERIERGETI